MQDHGERYDRDAPGGHGAPGHHGFGHDSGAHDHEARDLAASDLAAHDLAAPDRSTHDRSVRPAVSGDERAITRVQLAAWRSGTADALRPQVLDLLDDAAMRASWRVAITAPPAPGYRVLVACDGPAVVGFASVVPVAPLDDQGPGGQILALEVDPPHRRAGHGSRLLAAVVDGLRQDGADHLSTWVLHGDDARVRFLAQAGLGPDGASRRLTARADPGDGPVVTESRWVASI